MKDDSTPTLSPDARYEALDVAMTTAIDVAQDDGAPPAARVSAANLLVRIAESSVLAPNDEQRDLSMLTREELAALSRKLQLDLARSEAEEADETDLFA